MPPVDIRLLAAAALRFTRDFTKAARDSQLRPIFFAWNEDGFVDFRSGSQKIRIAVQHGKTSIFTVPTADLLKAYRGDPAARSSVNQLLQHIVAKLANEVASKGPSSAARK